MTMYPFLTGFWTSAGLSAGILFVLIHWSHRSAGLQALPVWLPPIIVALIFLSPLVGIAYAWWKLIRRRRQLIRNDRHRRFTGAIVGGVVIITSAALLLPSLWK